MRTLALATFLTSLVLMSLTGCNSSAEPEPTPDIAATVEAQVEERLSMAQKPEPSGNTQGSSPTSQLATPEIKPTVTLTPVLPVDAVQADQNPILHDAIWRGKTDIVQQLVDAGANVNAVDSDGDPLLHEAIWRGHTEIVRIMVAAGADVRATRPNGDTLIGEAIFRGHEEIVQILLDAGAGQ